MYLIEYTVRGRNYQYQGTKIGASRARHSSRAMMTDRARPPVRKAQAGIVDFFSLSSSSFFNSFHPSHHLLPSSCYWIVTRALYSLPLVPGGVLHSCSLPSLTSIFHFLRSWSKEPLVLPPRRVCLPTSWPPSPSQTFRPPVATGNGGCLHRQLILPLNPCSSFSPSLP